MHHLHNMKRLAQGRNGWRTASNSFRTADYKNNNVHRLKVEYKAFEKI